jgi:hypothetical protein
MPAPIPLPDTNGHYVFVVRSDTFDTAEYSATLAGERA